ncbi:MAG: CHAD domain-containing protein [Sphingobium sp.]|nr:CHAD domain-containing protein [Sphingobium sp.]MCP5399371.1 CHAD domain-containing protein [Sphingomonas sp.]
MNIEFELKLVPDKTAGADALSRALQLDAPETVRMRALYFDTPDSRLARSGYSLRIRQTGRKHIQTIKAGAAAGIFARREWEQPVRGNRLKLDADNPVVEALGKHVVELEPRYEVRTRRSIWMIETGDALIELALDHAEARAGGETSSFAEIELELKRGGIAALFALARRIGKLMPVRLGVLSKVERAQRLPKGAKPSDKDRKVALTPQMTAEDAFRAIVHACLRHYRLNEDRLIKDDNAEALHQARVALRRLRSAFAAFQPLIEGQTTRKLDADIRWLTGQFALARNIDAVTGHLGDIKWKARLRAKRKAAYADAHRAIDSTLSRELMLDIVQWASSGKWAGRHKNHKLLGKPAREYAAQTIGRLHKKLTSQAQAITGPDDERRHKARKVAKKLRYTVEFFALLFDKRKERKARIRYLAALEELQDHLGALNDMAMLPVLMAELGLNMDDMEYESRTTGERDFHIMQSVHAMNLLCEADRFWE